MGQFVARYNEVRLHSAIGFVTPKDKLEGRDAEIFAAGDRKLEAAQAEREVLARPPERLPAWAGKRGMEDTKAGRGRFV